jgi:transposase, IS30 family
MRHFLGQRWSPEQIALTLARIFPKGHEHRVSHETIHNCIYAQPVGEPKRELIATLPHAHNKRVPRSKGQDRRGQIPDMVSSHLSPARDRQFPGHWEGDLIKGAATPVWWASWSIAPADCSWSSSCPSSNPPARPT